MEKLVCINAGRLGGIQGDNLPPLILDKIYTCIAKRNCACGAVQVNVGLVSGGGNGICAKCGFLTVSDGIHWCAASRFVPLQEFSANETAVNELVKESIQNIYQK